jgi:hypothetical protein
MACDLSSASTTPAFTACSAVADPFRLTAAVAVGVLLRVRERAMPKLHMSILGEELKCPHAGGRAGN